LDIRPHSVPHIPVENYLQQPLSELKSQQN